MTGGKCPLVFSVTHVGYPNFYILLESIGQDTKLITIHETTCCPSNILCYKLQILVSVLFLVFDLHWSIQGEMKTSELVVWHLLELRIVLIQLLQDSGDI